MKACVRDCNLARCRVFPLYDDCVARHTLLNLLACMEKGEGREDAVRCLKERCGVQASDRPLTPE